MPQFIIEMDEKFNETLERLANGGSKGDVIRKAVASYPYLKSQVPMQTAQTGCPSLTVAVLFKPM